MKNFVFISPTFPDTYWQFPRAWKELGGNSLCIGEDPYEYLSENMKQACTEYYRVRSLQDYDEMYRAVAWFAHKYGKIDWLESNNEFWLEQDARLRTDFNITTGDDEVSVMRFKKKSTMKAFYQKAGVKTARYYLPGDLDGALAFLAEVGYPVIAKPDDGVGANGTFKIKNEEELRQFFASGDTAGYIMEEFITGEIWSFDGLTDQDGKIIYSTVHVYKSQVMDVLNDGTENYFYSLRDIPAEIGEKAAEVLRQFGIRARFFHTEYFVMSEDKEGLGKAGDLVGLEVNMRPPGGYILDMMNFECDVDLYRMYARMCMYNEAPAEISHSWHCVFAGRRDACAYQYYGEEIWRRYGQHICMSGRMPGILQGMADEYYIARFRTLEEGSAFAADAFAKR